MALTPAKQVEGLTVGTPELIGTITVNGTTYNHYRRIIKTGNLPNTSYLDIPLNFAHNAITAMYGATNNTNGYSNPLPYVFINNQGQLAAGSVLLQYRGSTEKCIRITTSSDMTTHYAFVTIEYY